LTYTGETVPFPLGGCTISQTGSVVGRAVALSVKT
jgi:hypothetical protein